MTRLLDVNVVVSAHRPDHAHHAALRPWFDRMLAEQWPLSIPSLVQGSFVRLVTNPRIFDEPTSRAEAFAFLHAAADRPTYVQLEPGPRHLELFEKACADAEAAGDLVADAYLAALAIEHGATLVSLDRDFARFEGLRRERPA